MTAIPSGTVTLLFTDIEGSTQRWEEDRSAMSEALRKHDELLRVAIESRGGHVFKTVGDAFCAAFSRAADGAQAALDAQRALLKEDWSGGGLRVRMALVATVDVENASKAVDSDRVSDFRVIHSAQDPVRITVQRHFRPELIYPFALDRHLGIPFGPFAREGCEMLTAAAIPKVQIYGLS